MPQKDFITTPLKISKTLTYDQKQLYRYFKKWLQERHYIVVELEHNEKVKADGGRVYAFEWYTEKRVGDFTKLTIELSFEAEVEDVKVELSDGKKKTAQKGTVSATFKGYIQKDVEEEWALTKERPQRRMLREMFDKFVARGKYAQLEAQLNKDIKAIMSDFKTYLKIHRYD